MTPPRELTFRFGPAPEGETDDEKFFRLTGLTTARLKELADEQASRPTGPHYCPTGYIPGHGWTI